MPSDYYSTISSSGVCLFLTNSSRYSAIPLYQFEQIVEDGCAALTPGKRWIILDLKSSTSETSVLSTLLSDFMDQSLGEIASKEKRMTWIPTQNYLGNTSLSKPCTGFVYTAPLASRGNVG